MESLIDAPLCMWLAIVAILLYLIKSNIYHGTKGLKLPPGPTGLPIIGCVLSLRPTVQEASMKLAKKYGDVFRMRAGSFVFVVVNGKKRLREAFVENIEAFAGRPKTFSSTVNAKGLSVFLSSQYDEAWKLQKKIMENTMQTFVDTKSSHIYDIILGEGNALADRFLVEKGKPFDPNICIMEHMGSIIYQICYGQSPNVHGDEMYKARLSRQRKVSEFWGAWNPVEGMPWTRYILPWITRRYRALVQTNTKERFGMIEERQKTFDPINPRDVIDGLILASTQYSETGKHETGLTKDHIFANLESIEGGGFDTINLSVRWAVLYMAKYSHVQDKARQEIYDTIGTRPPRMTDQSNLIYTKASLLEIMRVANVAPLVMHCTTTDAQLNGYDIPKGTRIIGNLYSTAFDKDFWGDPENFRPERFLGENGDLDKKKAGYFLPFGAGLRRCIGEKLARATIFLVLVTILQKCRIIKPPGEKLDVTALQAAFRFPKPFKVIFEETC